MDKINRASVKPKLYTSLLSVGEDRISFAERSSNLRPPGPKPGAPPRRGYFPNFFVPPGIAEG